MPSYFGSVARIDGKRNLLYIPKSPVDDGFGNLISNKLEFDLTAEYWMESDLEYFWLTGKDLLENI